MSGAASLDLRYPIGGLFVVLGVILVGVGVVNGAPAPTALLPTPSNINLQWGVVMVVTGAIFLVLAARAGRVAGARPAMSTPEGRATEEREHRRGLEH